MLARGGTALMACSSGHGLFSDTGTDSSYIQQQQVSSTSSSLAPMSDFSSSTYCYYQESIEQSLECCFYRESSDEEFFEDPTGIPKCEASTDSNPVESPVSGEVFADAFIGFDSGPLPTYEAQSEGDWEALVGSVLDSSADTQSGSVGSDERALLSVEQHKPDDAEEGTGKIEGAELVDLLVACAEAVSAKSSSLVHCLLARLGELASPEGGTAMERVAAYFTEGLACRVANERPDVYKPLPVETDPSLASACSSEAEEEAVAAYHILNHVSPIVKFAHFSANDAILEAFKGHDKVHVIDLDVGQGLQWPALFQALANRAEGPPALVRISGIGPFKDSVQETGERLAEFAQSLNLAFEFHPVIEKLDDIRLWMLHVKEGEAVAVNCIGQLHRSMQSRDQIQGVLELIRSARPVMVALVEQEASHNIESFEARFAGSLRYYAAVFDALDSSLLHRHSSAARTKVEKTIFAREIRNIVGCDGDERIERHESFGEWKKVMEAAGFASSGMSQRAVVQAKLLLQMFSCKEYRINEIEIDPQAERCQGIILAWLDQPLITVSAWGTR